MSENKQKNKFIHHHTSRSLKTTFNLNISMKKKLNNNSPSKEDSMNVLLKKFYFYL